MGPRPRVRGSHVADAPAARARRLRGGHRRMPLGPRIRGTGVLPRGPGLQQVRGDRSGALPPGRGQSASGAMPPRRTGVLGWTPSGPVRGPGARNGGRGLPGAWESANESNSLRRNGHGGAGRSAGMPAQPGGGQASSLSAAADRATHPKLREIAHQDFTDFSPIEPQLSGYDACFFCLGVSSIGMNEGRISPADLRIHPRRGANPRPAESAHDLYLRLGQRHGQFRNRVPRRGRGSRARRKTICFSCHSRRPTPSGPPTSSL